MLNVAIRVDSSMQIGSGHVMRCLVLADALHQEGHQVIFICRELKGHLIHVIEHRGFKVKRLAVPQTSTAPFVINDYTTWLQVPESDDAASCLPFLKENSLVIVDHYGIGKRWHTFVKMRRACNVAVIDDLAREHVAALIIDPTFLRQPNEYSFKNPNSLILSGTNYALLAPKFAQYNQQNRKIEATLKKPINVLLTLGAVDLPNATLKVLKTLKRLDLRIHVTVLLSPRAKHYEAVKHFTNQHKDWVTHFDFIDDVATLMNQHQLAIGASGSTTWERACIGLPCILIPLADNQLTVCKNMSEVGAAIHVPLNRISTDLIPAFVKLVTSYPKRRKINLSLCDGKGIERILKAINTLYKLTIKLRLATQLDIQQVYEWQCKPQTRQYALNKAVPSYEGHQTWMKHKLHNEHDYFYIIELGTQEHSSLDVGVVRLDMLTSNDYTLSIYIDPAYFGQGIAKLALQQIDHLHPKETITATVLKENLASQALFKSAGYKQVNTERFIRLPLE